LKTLKLARSTARKQWRVKSELSGVPKASQKVLSFLKPLDLSEAFLFDIRLCLEEALINAIKYGNQLKKERKVLLEAEFDNKEVRVSVEDQGEGFDPAGLQDCTKEGLLRNRGRGVYLIHQLMDRVEHNAKGNRILMVKKIAE
jgi:serine/threonine-protein kinase RsbW